MTVSAPNSAPPVQRERVPTEQPPGGERPRGREGSETPPGGERPSDFGHRDADANHDGTISDGESRVYDADVRSEDRRYTADSRERVAHEREEGKNYRADVSAATAQNASNNDNKMHKMFGKQSAPVQMPTRPEGPSPS